MDVGLLPACCNALPPAVDDGHGDMAKGDAGLQGGFGSALAVALGEGGQGQARPTAAEPQARHADSRGGGLEAWDLAGMPATPGGAKADAPNPAVVMLGYPVLEWLPLPVVPPAGVVPLGGVVLAASLAPPAGTVPAATGLEDAAWTGDSAELAAEANAGAGALSLPAGLPAGDHQPILARESIGPGSWNSSAFPLRGLGASQLLSRLARSNGDATGAAADRLEAAVSAASAMDAKPLPENQALPAASTAVPISIPDVLACPTPIDQMQSSPVTPPEIDERPVADAEPPAYVPGAGDASLAGAPRHGNAGHTRNTPAPDFSTTTSEVGEDSAAVPPKADATGIPAGTPAGTRAAGGSSAEMAGPPSGVPMSSYAPPRRTPSAVPTTVAAESGGDSLFEATTPAADPAVASESAGSGPRAGMSADSQTGFGAPRTESGSVSPQDQSRIEARRHLNNAFVLDQQTSPAPATEARPQNEANTGVAPAPATDRPVVDRRWMPGPAEPVPGALAEAVAAVSSTAGRSDTGGQSAGRDDNNNRGYGRRPPAAAPLLYSIPTLATSLEFTPERVALTDAARVMAEPPMPEPTVNGAPLSHTLVQSLKMQWKQGGGEAHLRLNPEHLGELTVSLKVQGSTVSAVLQCDSPSVRAWVETHQADLRRALEAQGLTLDTITVDADGHPQQQESSSQREPRPRHRSRGDNKDGQFEAFL